MENFAPGLRESILSLTDVLRVIVFFVCVAGLVLQIQQARADMEGLTRPLIRATVVVGLIATLPYWFGFTERVFLTVAEYGAGGLHASIRCGPPPSCARPSAAAAPSSACGGSANRSTRRFSTARPNSSS